MALKVERVALETEEFLPVYAIMKAARALGIHRVTLYRWLRSGKIIGIALGDKTYIPKSEIERIKAAIMLYTAWGSEPCPSRPRRKGEP